MNSSLRPAPAAAEAAGHVLPVGGGLPLNSSDGSTLRARLESPATRAAADPSVHILRPDVTEAAVGVGDILIVGAKKLHEGGHAGIKRDCTRDTT